MRHSGQRWIEYRRKSLRIAFYRAGIRIRRAASKLLCGLKSKAVCFACTKCRMRRSWPPMRGSIRNRYVGRRCNAQSRGCTRLQCRKRLRDSALSTRLREGEPCNHAHKNRSCERRSAYRRSEAEVSGPFEPAVHSWEKVQKIGAKLLRSPASKILQSALSYSSFNATDKSNGRNQECSPLQVGLEAECDKNGRCGWGFGAVDRFSLQQCCDIITSADRCH